MLETLKQLIKDIYAWAEAIVLRVWGRAEAWAKTETSRALVDPDAVPEITGKRMGSVIVRSVPFMWPMIVHIIVFLLLGTFLTGLFNLTGMFTSDVWDNKTLVNDKLQPFQAFVLFVDKSYLRPEFLEDYVEPDSQSAESETEPEPGVRDRIH